MSTLSNFNDENSNTADNPKFDTVLQTRLSRRGLLAINHEATTDETRSSFLLHANGGTSTLPRPAAEVDKEVPIHGISVVEVNKTAPVRAVR